MSPAFAGGLFTTESPRKPTGSLKGAPSARGLQLPWTRATCTRKPDGAGIRGLAEIIAMKQQREVLPKAVMS